VERGGDGGAGAGALFRRIQCRGCLPLAIGEFLWNRIANATPSWLSANGYVDIK